MWLRRFPSLIALLGLLIGLVLVTGGYVKALPEITLEGFAMDSYWRVSALLPQGPGQEFSLWLPGELERLDERYDLFTPDSYLSRFNQGEVPADEELQRLLSKAEPFVALSGGAYQLDIASLTQLWKDALAKEVPPDPAQVERALSEVGEDHLQLDLGSLLKGYAADLAYANLKAAGAKRALIDMGGTIRVLGRPSFWRGNWRVGVRNPQGSGTLGYFRLQNGQAIATSGDYERGFDYQGRRYHHLLDPRTGYPAGEYRAVTVVTEDALTADILSTLLFVAGPEVISQVEEVVPCRALFVDKKGKIEIYGSLNVEWVKN
ncbi:MAG: FAD:protein FMN transferase [Firmicutes bacterium]|nr:FAD:protein FMN transferase [Bacillota bacterium]